MFLGVGKTISIASSDLSRHELLMAIRAMLCWVVAGLLCPFSLIGGVLAVWWLQSEFFMFGLCCWSFLRLECWCMAVFVVAH